MSIPGLVVSSYAAISANDGHAAITRPVAVGSATETLAARLATLPTTRSAHRQNAAALGAIAGKALLDGINAVPREELDEDPFDHWGRQFVPRQSGRVALSVAWTTGPRLLGWSREPQQTRRWAWREILFCRNDGSDVRLSRPG